MKKFLLVLIICGLLPANLYARKTKLEDCDYVIDNKTKLDKILKNGKIYKNETVSGMLCFEDENYDLYNIPLKYGIPHGEFKIYFLNGKVNTEVTYENGLKVGPYKTYYKNGKKSSISNYENGKLNGQTIIYYSNGKVEQEVNYENDKAQGIVRDYYENGKIKAETNYINDKINGTSTGFYEEGNFKYIKNYKNDKLNGSTIYYFKNGQIELEIGYVNDEFHGPKKEYNINGFLILEENYNHDKLDGMKKVYDNETGKITKEENFSNGKIMYDNYFFENGAVEINGKYTYNNKNKTENRTVYDDDGKIWAKLVLVNGSLTSGVCGDGRKWTKKDIENWNNKLKIECKSK